MKIMFILILACCMIWTCLILKVEVSDLKQILKSAPVLKIREISYFGLIRYIEMLGGHYPFRRYLMQSVTVGSLCGLLCYTTTGNWFYASIIAGLTVFFIPSFFYMNLKRLAQQKLEKEIFTYVSTAILYVREDKNSLRILKDCAELAEGVLHDDLMLCVEKIEADADFSTALDELERKYPYAQLRNLHLLLKGKKNEGGRNEQLIDYLFDNTEESELLINDYRQKKEAGRKVFYFMLILNLIAVLIMKKMFHSSSAVDLNTAGFQFCVLCFYLMNAVTLFWYEHWCSNQDRVE